MASTRMNRLSISCMTLGVLTMAGCPFSSKLTLRNETGVTLTPYPVVTTPPPPHREADSANQIPTNGSAEIDTRGFNPVYYVPGISDVNRANGVYIGLQLDGDDDPFLIQYKVFHYKVPPGQAGHDPAKQPILLHSGVQEVTDVDHGITIKGAGPVGPPPPPGGWRVTIAPD